MTSKSPWRATIGIDNTRGASAGAGSAACAAPTNPRKVPAASRRSRSSERRWERRESSGPARWPAHMQGALCALRVSVAAPDKTELCLHHAGRTVGIRQVDPVLLYRQSQRGGAREVPAHSQAGLVNELIHAMGGLDRGADLAVPGIPPAACGWPAIWNIGIDEGIAETRHDERRKGARHQVVVQVNPRGEGFHVATHSERAAALPDQCAFVVDFRIVESEMQFQVRIEPVAEVERQAPVIIKLDDRTELGRERRAVLIDDIEADIPSCLARLRTGYLAQRQPCQRQHQNPDFHQRPTHTRLLKLQLANVREYTVASTIRSCPKGQLVAA